MTASKDGRFPAIDRVAGAADAWLLTEKFLLGRIVDLPDSTHADLRVETPSGIKTLSTTISASLTETLCAYLRQPVRLRVTMEENIVTGQQRHLHLLSIDDYLPAYNAEEFERMVDLGTKAWANISDPTDWLETLRGNRA